MTTGRIEDNEDVEQTPVEELPGILGYQWDDFDFVALDPCLSAITEIDLREIQEAQEVAEGFKLEVLTSEGLKIIEIGTYGPIFPIFGDLPSLVVEFDCPPNQGPAGGAGYLFFLAGLTTKDVKREVDSFCAALKLKVAGILSAG